MGQFSNTIVLLFIVVGSDEKGCDRISRYARSKTRKWLRKKALRILRPLKLEVLKMINRYHDLVEAIVK